VQKVVISTGSKNFKQAAILYLHQHINIACLLSSTPQRSMPYKFDEHNQHGMHDFDSLGSLFS